MTENLDRGGAEAIQALLTSLAPEGSSDAPRLTPQALERLTQKMEELGLGETNQAGGELVNEEGLPIVDVTEPAGAPIVSATGDSLISDEDPLVRWDLLSSFERERRARERDRILDMLEAEEVEEETEREAREEAERREERERLRKKHKGELDKIKGMHKKMGKALLRGLANDRDAGSADAPTPTSPPTEVTKPKKSVAFATSSSTTEDDPGRKEWGDVATGRLRAKADSLVHAMTPADQPTMKATVVERTPSGAAPPPSLPEYERDSDDESEPPGSPIAVDSDEDLADDDMDEDELGETGLEPEEFDLDYATQQREIALEYHRKRATIGQAALDAMRSHTHDEHDDVVPTDDPPVQIPSAKPAVSRFKASKMASAYNTEAGPTHPSHSHSLDASVVPEATTRTIQGAIRTGKLDADNKLVSGPDDSGSEDENELAREMFEMLKKGELVNMGPGEVQLVSPPQSADATASAPIPSPAAETSTRQSQSTGSIPVGADKLMPLNKPKPTSRFKVAMSQAGRAPPASPLSEAATPISTTGRSSPKMPVSPAVMERKTYSVVEPGSPAINPPVLPRLAAVPIESRTSSVGSSATVVGSPAFSSMIVNSASFPSMSPTGTTNKVPNTSSGAPYSMVVESPSFPSPSARQQRRPERPPDIMATAVRESTGTAYETADAPSPSKRVSRFKAERG
ncbi:hypothetical protein BD626DRAFT_497629 [Schizophyllum amplum]|uniref:DUF3835 domain-containing protein n=1 Tax=Schizophyllum amplum TaxID=97359 RepID=A0A550CCK3_9AGAR|nr:hypothetical protein BD626DRAFT_497629 [Auriculariopsis ampla]